MQVLFKLPVSDELPPRAGLERRVRVVLRRVSWRVPRVTLYFADLNGPRGGIDKRLVIEMRPRDTGPVVVSSVKKTWRAALNDALERLMRFVRRGMDRARGTPRVSRRAPRVEPPVDV